MQGDLFRASPGTLRSLQGGPPLAWQGTFRILQGDLLRVLQDVKAGRREREGGEKGGSKGERGRGRERSLANLVPGGARSWKVGHGHRGQRLHVLYLRRYATETVISKTLAARA